MAVHFQFATNFTISSFLPSGLTFHIVSKTLAMIISKNKVVTLAYELTDEDGSIIERITSKEPFTYFHGFNRVLEAFEAALEGMKMGQHFAFTLTPENAYGDYDSERIVEIDIEIFDEAPEGSLEIGATVPMQDEEGNPLYGVIIDLNDDFVVMDFNDPLAGRTLNFKGEILVVRDPTRIETETGKVDEA